MVPRTLALLCFSFALASSSPVESDDWWSLHEHAIEARDILSTLSDECTTNSHLVTVEYMKALYSIFNCSYTEVINDIGNVALETATYVAMDYSTISKLVVKLTACSTKVNPLKIIECDLNEIETAFSDIKSLFISTKNFITDMKTLIPPLKAEIENCLSLSSLEYKLFLKTLIEEAVKCESNL